MVQTIYIYNQCDMVAEQPQIVSKKKVREAVAARPLVACTARIFSLFTLHFSLKSIYRKELKAARAAAQMIDSYPTLSTTILLIMGILFFIEIILHL